MKLSNVRYDLIGSHPEMADVDLADLIEQFETVALVEQPLIATAIIKAAEHFYGLTLEHGMTMLDLIDAIEAKEQELAV